MHRDHLPPRVRLLPRHLSLVAVLALGLAFANDATAQNTNALGENGWFSDDTRADGTGTQSAGTNLVSDTLTDDPEAGASGTPTHDADILAQIQFGPAAGSPPSGTAAGAVHLTIGASGSGKSQISHRKTDAAGHATGAAAFGAGMTASYSWMGDGTVSVTASLKFGVRTPEFGSTGSSPRTGENAWDKVMIYEPGNLNGGTSDGLWKTETIDFTTGRWWFFDRTAGAGTIGMPLTLSDMSTSPFVFSGSKTIADVYALITHPDARITSAQVGIGSGNAGGSVHVNQVETSFYRPGSITTFASPITKVSAFAPSTNTTPGVWYESFLSSAGAAGIVDLTGAGGDLETNQPIPVGAVQLTTTTDNNDRANVGVLDLYGQPADIFSSLRFAYSYHKATNAGQNLTAAPTLKLAIFNALCDDPASAGDCFGQLIYEPSWNQPSAPGSSINPPLDLWQTVEIDGDNGLFWWTGGFGQPNGAGGPPLRTLNDWFTFFSSDFGDADLFRVEIGVGSFNQNQLAYFDDVLIAHGFGAGFAKRFDFDIPETGELALSAANCQDDADGSTGYQIEVELRMLNLTGTASGYAAFLDYDLGVLSYRGDLSSYTATPFPLNISPILQPDDGLLELDGSLNFMDPPTSSNALLATLVFDVLVGCDPATLPIDFEVGGTFPSELSLDGVPIDTTLTPPAPFSLDDTPPIFPSCPDVVQAADASLVDGCVGAIVNYVDPVATDNCPGVPTVVCSPPSGSMFLVGTTPVTCTATDACGNASMCMFNVTVTPTNVVCVEVELIGVSTPVTRCIRFVADDCSFADVSLSFIDHDAMMGTPVRAIAEIEIPCGEYASLCAKDEQHTKWETVTMSLSGVKYVTDTLISLTGGDTDNDGDVDINDVTWFLFQFGDLTAPGGCPWNGTRDADFSNNGAIGSEDYTFLTANWLTTSTCACTFPAEIERPHFLPARQRATSARARAVDLNQDGWVDFADVEIFEKRHGLPHELSKRMRQ